MMGLRSAITKIISVACLVTASATPSSAQSPCVDDPAYAVLDFWLGEWDVMVEDRRAGTNRIEKILSGCAIMEHWSATGGGEGKSLFYRAPAEDTWKQVWVTENPARPGGVKEKTLVERSESGGTVFVGEVTLPSGQVVLDRTRLIPLEGGRVRQVIEYSADEGATWEQLFDAIYVPAADAAQ